MEITVRPYRPDDLPAMRALWNSVVAEGDSFPQDAPLDEKEAEDFFAGQSRSGVADDNGDIVGLYILHPTAVQ